MKRIKKMKKVLSSLIAAALTLSLCAAPVSATEYTDDIAVKYKILNTLGIIQERELGGDYEFVDVSKAAFINMVCNLMGDYRFSGGYNEEAIRIAEDAGLIHAGQTDLIKPLNYEEAVTILVRLLGFGFHAEQGGAWPAGYISVASKLGLNDDVTSVVGQQIREHDIINLLYNTINCGYVEEISFSEDGVVYGSGASDRTYLYEFRKIYRIDGVVEGTELSGVRSDKVVSAGEVMIDGYKYITDADLTDYLGMKIEGYVKEDANGLDTLICAFPYSNNTVLEIDAEELVGVTDDYKTLQYYINDKEKNARIAPIASVLYNGQPLKDYTDEAFKIRDGSIRLIENTGDSLYDVVFITEYKTVIVEHVSTANKTIESMYTYDGALTSLNMEAQGDDYIRIFDKDGNEVALSKLAKGNVLKVAQSEADGRRVVKAYLSTEKISGTVTQKYDKEDIVIVVDGSNYILSEGFEEALAYREPSKTPDTKAKTPVPGVSYTFYLDSDGEIAFADEMEGSVQYGLVMAAVSKNTAFGISGCIKLMSSDGVCMELPMAEKITMGYADGTETKTEVTQALIDSIPEAVGGDISVIEYTVNGDGEINKLALPVPYDKTNGNNGRFNVFDKYRETKQDYRTNRSFESEIFLTAPVVWTVREPMAEEESYTVISAAEIQTNSLYKFVAYNVDEMGVAEHVVLFMDAEKNTESVERANLFVVDSVGEQLNSQGETVGCISGMMGKYENLTYNCDETIDFSDDDSGSFVPMSSLKKGDVISVTSDSRGNILSAKRYCSSNNGEMQILVKPAIGNTDMETYRLEMMVYGTVVKNDTGNTLVKIDIDGDEGDACRVVRVSSDAAVIIYDRVTDELRMGNIYDIEKGAQIMTKINQANSVSTLVIYQ